MKPGSDETAGLIVDERAWGSAGKNVGRLADRLDQAAVNEHGAILDERISARAALSRIVGERENAATNDASDRGQVRISFSLSAAIRSISASAVFVSASASLARRWRKAARMSAVLLAFDRHDEGKAEPRAISVVELAELAQFVGRQPVKPGARLLARRFRGQRLGEGELAGQIRVGVDQRALLFRCPFRCGVRERLRQPFRRVGAARETSVIGAPPRSMANARKRRRSAR